ncbi:MAG: S53 family peptidase [Candidatus Nanopelagicales bacterium]
MRTTTSSRALIAVTAGALSVALLGTMPASAGASLPGQSAAPVSGTAVAGTPATAASSVPAEDRALESRWGPAPRDARVTFYLVMSRNEKAARAAFQRVSDPTSSQYRRFPSRAEVVQTYGAKAQHVATVQRQAAAAGMKATLDKTGLFMRITGTARQWKRWTGKDVLMRVLERNLTDQTALEVRLYRTFGQPPARVMKASNGTFLGEYVKWITIRKSADRAAPLPGPLPTNQGTWVDGCDAAEATNSYSYQQLMTAYGIDALSRSATVGRATRLAIVELGVGWSPSALAASAECFDAQGRRFVNVLTDGMKGALTAGLEGNLDTQLAQAILPPGSQVSVVEGPESPSTWFLTFASVFGLAEQPDVVSVSYGLCEPLLAEQGLTAVRRALLDSVLVRLGLVGSTVAISSGDDGSSDCVEATRGTVRAPTVDYPSASPYVTSIGGSRIVLNKDNSRAREVTWRQVNVNGAPPGEPAQAVYAGGGGGRSVLYEQPWWQARFGIRQQTRTLPDVAMHASFGPGWPVYAQGGFQPVAGTSAATPLFASALATWVAMERLAGRPAYGHIAPAMYDVVARDRGAAYDIVKTSNDVYDVGCCKAKTGYDLASGLGAPNFDVFPRLLAPVGGW